MSAAFKVFLFGIVLAGLTTLACPHMLAGLRARLRGAAPASR